MSLLSCGGKLQLYRGSINSTYTLNLKKEGSTGCVSLHTDLWPHTHTHIKHSKHSPPSSWHRGTRDTPVSRCLESERCRRTLYHAFYQPYSTISCRQTPDLLCYSKLYTFLNVFQNVQHITNICFCVTEKASHTLINCTREHNAICFC